VKIPGAVFLNDVTVTPDGNVLVSDTGMKAGASGVAPAAGAAAVYAVDKARKVTALAKSKDLGAPNGLLAVGDTNWVASFSGNELYALDHTGKNGDVHHLPKGSLDGIVRLPGGELLVASWDGKAVYRGRPGGTFKAAIEDVNAPADIGFDARRARVLVPLFENDEIRAYDMK
jgi:sugar lactone lactonase YvrE